MGRHSNESHETMPLSPMTCIRSSPYTEESIIRRRNLLKSALSAPVLPLLGSPAVHAEVASKARLPRVRPGESGWPDSSQWEALNERVGGRLVVPQSPFVRCGATAAKATKYLGNPYYLGDEVGLAQSSGWLGAWTLQSSR